MPSVGIGILWFGYSVLYYGITQVNGGTWGFLDLVVPSRWTAEKAAQPRDSGQSAATSVPGATGVTKLDTGGTGQAPVVQYPTTAIGTTGAGGSNPTASNYPNGIHGLPN